jgi:hypothetical protein
MVSHPSPGNQTVTNGKFNEKALKDSGLGNKEVTPFLRLRVVGLTYKTRQEKPKEGIVTIWNPTQKQVNLMSQLQRLIIFLHINNFSAFLWL